MKNAVVTLLGVLVLAITTASVAFGAQASLMSSAMRGMSDSLASAVLQEPLSGTIAGIVNLPSTSTGGGMNALVLVIGGLAAVSAAFVLVRKAVVDS